MSFSGMLWDSEMFRSMRPVISSIGTHFRLDAVWLNRWYRKVCLKTHVTRDRKPPFRGSHIASSKGAGATLLRPGHCSDAWSGPPSSPSRLVYGKTVIFSPASVAETGSFSWSHPALPGPWHEAWPRHRLQTHHVLQQVVEILEDVLSTLTRDRVTHLSTVPDFPSDLAAFSYLSCSGRKPTGSFKKIKRVLSAGDGNGAAELEIGFPLGFYRTLGPLLRSAFVVATPFSPWPK